MYRMVCSSLQMMPLSARLSSAARFLIPPLTQKTQTETMRCPKPDGILGERQAGILRWRQRAAAVIQRRR